MIKNILFVVATLASFSAFAQETWVGYKPIEQVQAPHKELAMAAVLRIRTVTLLDSAPEDYEIVNTEETKKVTDTAKLDADLRAWQVETCRNQGLKKCPVFKVGSTGTGFVNSGRDLYTCRHMFHNWLRIAADKNNISIDQISPPMKIFDMDKNVLYNSGDSKDLMEITAINKDERLDFFLKDTRDSQNPLDRLYVVSDFVALKAVNNLIESHAFPTSKSIAVNDQIYISGYPAKTTFFKGKRGDTPGDILVSSTGMVSAVSQAYQLFLADALGTGGMSGGLVTNASGSVIGIFCKSEDVVKGKSINGTSAIFDIAAQKRVWTFYEQNPI